MVIAVDSGTLHNGTHSNIGNPLPYVVEAMTKIKNSGHRIIIATCRQGSKLDDLHHFLDKNKIPYDLINDNFPIIKEKLNDPRKICADVYIDKKNILGVPPWNLIYDLLGNTTVITNLHRYLPLILNNRL
jgi:hydroxymethylpyrimidine pyrophosphatase-like HAD family hydrolase